MTILASVQRTTDHLEKSVRTEAKALRRSFDAVNEQTVHYVRENPGKCMLGALAVGIIVGRVARR